MGRKDVNHGLVMGILVNSGFTVIKELPHVKIGKRRPEMDLLMKNGKVFAVEIKNFISLSTILTTLSHVLGQIGTFKYAQRLNNLDYPCYLALPLKFYNEIAKDDIFLQYLNDMFNYFIYDEEKGEILHWQPLLS